MKKVLIQSVFFLSLLNSNYHLTAQVLTGQVKGSDQSSLIQTSVIVSGVGSDITDSDGRYSIDLKSCDYCTPGQTLVVSVNSDYGSTKIEWTIPTHSNYKPLDIVVPQNNKLILTGKVKSKRTGKFISGIQVTPLIVGYGIEIPSVITDSRGIFSFILNKSGIGLNQAIELTFIDITGGRYRDDDEIVFISQRAPLTIELEECSNCGERKTIPISGYKKTDLKLEPGDVVNIKASGVIKVGDFVGTSGPDGLSNNRGVFGLSLAGYNFYPDWNHAVLLYRFSESEEWHYYDSQKENKFLIQNTGYLEFSINDNKQEDNSGAYDVEVVLQR